MADDAEARLRSFVHSIVTGAAVPSRVRDDLEEEMLGHLLERLAAQRAAGIPADDAAQRVIAEFGDPAALSADLARTYHSSVWASTVGVLLAHHVSEDRRPRAVSAMAFVVGVAAALNAIGAAVGIATFTPGRAVVAGVSGFVLVAMSVLVVKGLTVGQRWAFSLGRAVLAVFVVAGIVQAIAAPPETTIIPLGSIVAGSVLVWALGERGRIAAWFAGSPAIGRRLATALAAAFVAGSFGDVAGPTLTDPTQARPSDVDMVLAMDCGQRPFQVPDGPLIPDQQFARIEVDLSWGRTDLLPFGLAGLTGQDRGGDTAGFRMIDAAPPASAGRHDPSWLLLENEPSITVAETGQVAGWFGSTSPSVALIPDTIGSFTVGIEPSALAPGRTIRIAWVVAPSQDGTQPPPRAEVAYAHLDRFLLLGTVGCGERRNGIPQPLPAVDARTNGSSRLL